MKIKWGGEGKKGSCIELSLSWMSASSVLIIWMAVFKIQEIDYITTFKKIQMSQSGFILLCYT